MDILEPTTELQAAGASETKGATATVADRAHPGAQTEGEEAEKSAALTGEETSRQPADGIAILVKLAESGDIDPKNVDIIDVTDKFLKAIAAAPKENLRQSGKILFHASVLLRMKAEALLAAASAELETGSDDFLDFDEDGAPIIYDSQNQPVARQITLQDLERALVRRANNRQARQRKVTLQQLIEALKEAERIEKERVDKKPRARIDLSGQIDVNDVDDILELAHDEDIEVTIQRVEQLIDSTLNIGEYLSLIKLIQLLGPKRDWVDAFLAVLFLSNAGKITLEQEQFYGPVYLVRCDAESQTVKTGT
ncbi:MAG TPA: segregation/condensation protein A [Candidatus Obscuribacterales bacterium]